jgi:hypothetical protein
MAAVDVILKLKGKDAMAVACDLIDLERERLELERAQFRAQFPGVALETPPAAPAMVGGQPVPQIFLTPELLQAIQNSLRPDANEQASVGEKFPPITPNPPAEPTAPAP